MKRIERYSKGWWQPTPVMFCRPLLVLLIGLAVPAAGSPPVIETDFASIEVDPPVAPGKATNRLREADSVTPVTWDWDSGKPDGWTGRGINGIKGLTAAGGVIGGQGSSDDPYVEITGLDGPDLDFGFYDYLQIRLRREAETHGDVIFRFGTSTEGGNDSRVREFRIPARRVPRDGAWHTYRIDLGLIPRYRDKLTDLRIYPLGDRGAGTSFAIDFIEIGDRPGDRLWVNTALNLPPSLERENVRNLESKHAVVWWKDGSEFDPALHGRRALRMIEEAHQVYTKILGYKEPFENWEPSRRDGKRYKVNHVTWFDGFWMGGHEGFGHLNVPWQGLLDEGWGNPVPHEYAHVVQSHQINFLAGGHWESHANYLRQAWQTHHAFRFPKGQQSALSLEPLINSNFRQDHGRLIYADYRIHHALESLAGTVLGRDFPARLWFEGTKDATCYTKLAALLPDDRHPADVIAMGLRRWPFFDFKEGPYFKDQHSANPADKTWHRFITGSMLVPSQDKPGWWRVPFPRAPERFAFMHHELEATASTVTVEMKGIDVMGDTEDWRWSLAAVDASGHVRYSDVFSPGTRSMAIQSGEKEVHLIVVATPTDHSLNLEWTDNRWPTDRHADRLRYPYEVRIEGAKPLPKKLDWTTAAGSRHPNGGGWKADSATVDASAFIGPNARVLGSARVLDKARVEDSAVVTGNAVVRDHAVVTGCAVVRDDAQVSGHARVRDRAVLAASARLSDNAMAIEYARPEGNITLSGDAIARGQTTSWAGNIGGHAILDYDCSTGHDMSNGVHFAHVPWGDWYADYWWNTRAKPRGLIASYRIDEPEGRIVWDEFGAAHALLEGEGRRVRDPRLLTTVMRLDGKSAYLVLNRNLCALRSATFSLRVKPNGPNANRAVLFMGSAADRHLRILARDGNGRARATITNGTTTTEWVSKSAVPEGEWTNLAITMDAAAGSGTLHVNGRAEDTRTTPLLPENVLGPNDHANGEALYIGRDWDGNLFSGDIVDARFFNVALTAGEIEESSLRSGACIGVFLTGGPIDTQAGNSAIESGVIDGLQRALKATIRPRSPQPDGYYGAVFDSSDERDAGIHGSGFGLRGRRIWVRLANVGFWDTGVDAVMDRWQTVALSYDGSDARLFIDGKQRAHRTYQADQSHVAGKNFRIGFARSAEPGAPKFHFNGEIRDVFIYDNADAVRPSVPAIP